MYLNPYLINKRLSLYAQLQNVGVNFFVEERILLASLNESVDALIVALKFKYSLFRF